VLRKQKAAAYFDPWKYKIEQLSKSDVVFLYQSGVGLVAMGRASGKLEKADYHGNPKDKDEEYFMALEEFQRLEPPVPATKIKEVTGKDHRFMMTMFSTDAKSASALLGYLQRRGSDAEQVCPICSKTVRANPRYPRYVCEDCSAKATSADGRALTFSNVSLSGGYAARYADTGEDYPSHDCFIKGVRCHADEARFGGIVIQVVD
jgi:hypothetical protein